MPYGDSEYKTFYSQLILPAVISGLLVVPCVLAYLLRGNGTLPPLLAVIALFKRGGIVSCTLKDCLCMITYSLLPPLAFALLWSGRFCMIRDFRLRLVIAAGLLLALTVPLFVFVHRKTRRDPSASFARTMLLPLALCLFLTGAILRPLLDHRIRFCWQRDTLFRPAVSCSTLDDRMRNYLIDNLTAFLQEKSLERRRSSSPAGSPENCCGIPRVPGLTCLSDSAPGFCFRRAAKVPPVRGFAFKTIFKTIQFVQNNIEISS